MTATNDGKPELGDAPVEDRYQQQMTRVVQALDIAFNGDATGPDRTTGFILMVFPFGTADGRCNYMSNGADRRDVVKLLEEQLARFKAQQQ